jgi:hypothetical protein
MAVDAARAKSFFLAASELSDPAARIYLHRTFGRELRRATTWLGSGSP